MQIRFFGVRGSIAAPQLPSQIKSKISAILERLTPEDIAVPKTVNAFWRVFRPGFSVLWAAIPPVSLYGLQKQKK
jgi:hypothetical protein